METRCKKCAVQNVTQLLPLRHLQSLLCTISQKRHVISHRHLTEGTGCLGGGTYSSEVYGGTEGGSNQDDKSRCEEIKLTWLMNGAYHFHTESVYPPITTEPAQTERAPWF